MRNVNKTNISIFVGVFAIVAILSAGVTYITSAKAGVSHLHVTRKAHSQILSDYR
jgi:hypothetical protein